MEPLSFGEAHPRPVKLFPGAAMPAFGDRVARYFRSRPWVEKRPIPAATHVREQMPRAQSRYVASRDLRSPLQLIADSLIVVALSVITGTAYQEVFRETAGPVADFAYTGLMVAVLFGGIDRLVGGRHPAILTNRFDRLREATLVWNLTFSALLFFLFSLKASSGFSRGAVLSFYLIGMGAVGVWRAFAPPALARVSRKAGYAAHQCIVIGDGEDAALDEFAAELSENGRPAPMIVRFRARCRQAAWSDEHKQLIINVINAAHTLHRGEIYLCASAVPVDRLAAVQRALSILPRAIYVVPDAATTSLVRCKPASIGNYIAVEVRCEPLNLYQQTVKRLIDVTVASAAIAFLAPFLAAIAVAIKLDSAGPVLFRQTRNGYRGQPFKILKFRSMRVQEDGPVIRQACKGDTRVTRVGCFLRKTSIDELPQLFNVLIGQMSLVGPRPHAQAHDELYARSIENYEVRQHVKPGLTGWAQVHGLRGETATVDQMYQRIELDLWYAVNASLLLDVEILVRTAFEVFRQRNAY